MSIEEILNNAYLHVPYYNHIFNLNKIDTNAIKTIEKIPITTKDDVRNYGLLNFINNKYLDENNRFNNEFDMVITASSGTTGVPMDVIWDKKTYLRSTLSHWFVRNKRAQILSKDVFITSQRYKGNTNAIIMKSENEFAINTNLFSHNNLVNIISEMNVLQPKWLLIQSSVLYVLLRFANDNNLTLPKSIKYIEYYSETALPYYREEIEKNIKCVTANMYACSETNGIAYECRCGKLHIFENNVMVEILKRNRKVGYNKIGYVCVTNLHNHVMPIIRYKLNDKAKLVNSECDCGDKTQIIELINMRTPEFILFDDLQKCVQGKLYFPIERLSFIERKKLDIVFTMSLDSTGVYNIVFDSKTCFGKSFWKISKVFKNIMCAYGLKECKFEINFSDKLDEGLHKGILRL